MSQARVKQSVFSLINSDKEKGITVPQVKTRLPLGKAMFTSSLLALSLGQAYAQTDVTHSLTPNTSSSVLLAQAAMPAVDETLSSSDTAHLLNTDSIPLLAQSSSDEEAVTSALLAVNAEKDESDDTSTDESNDANNKDKDSQDDTQYADNTTRTSLESVDTETGVSNASVPSESVLGALVLPTSETGSVNTSSNLSLNTDLSDISQAFTSFVHTDSVEASAISMPETSTTSVLLTPSAFSVAAPELSSSSTNSASAAMLTSPVSDSVLWGTGGVAPVYQDIMPTAALATLKVLDYESYTVYGTNTVAGLNIVYGGTLVIGQGASLTVTGTSSVGAYLAVGRDKAGVSTILNTEVSHTPTSSVLITDGGVLTINQYSALVNAWQDSFILVSGVGSKIQSSNNFSKNSWYLASVLVEKGGQLTGAGTGSTSSEGALFLRTAIKYDNTVTAPASFLVTGQGSVFGGHWRRIQLGNLAYSSPADIYQAVLTLADGGQFVNTFNAPLEMTDGTEIRIGNKDTRGTAGYLNLASNLIQSPFTGVTMPAQISFYHNHTETNPAVFGVTVGGPTSATSELFRFNFFSGWTKLAYEYSVYGSGPSATFTISGDRADIPVGVIAGTNNALGYSANVYVEKGVLDLRGTQQNINSLLLNKQGVLRLTADISKKDVFPLYVRHYGVSGSTGRDMLSVVDGTIALDLVGLSGSGTSSTITLDSLTSSSSLIRNSSISVGGSGVEIALIKLDHTSASPPGRIVVGDNAQVSLLNSNASSSLDLSNLPNYIFASKSGGTAGSLLLKNNDSELYYVDSGYTISLCLTWNCGGTTPNRGTFNVDPATQLEFTVDTVLANQTDFGADWDGRTLTKTGAGTLILSANNTFDGSLLVNQGILILQAGQVLTGKAGAAGEQVARVSGTSEVAGVILNASSKWLLSTNELTIGGYLGSVGVQTGTVTVNSGLIKQNYYTGSDSYSILRLGLGSKNQGILLLSGPDARVEGNWGHSEGQNGGVIVADLNGALGSLIIEGGAVFSNLISYYDGYATDVNYRNTYKTRFNIYGNEGLVSIDGVGSRLEGDWSHFEVNKGALAISNSGVLVLLSQNTPVTDLQLKNDAVMVIEKGGNLGGSWSTLALDRSVLRVTSGGTIGGALNLGAGNIIGQGKLLVGKESTLTVNNARITGLWGFLAIYGDNSQAALINYSVYEKAYATDNSGWIHVAGGGDYGSGISRLTVSDSVIKNIPQLAVGVVGEGLMHLDRSVFTVGDGLSSIAWSIGSGFTDNDQGVLYLNEGSLITGYVKTIGVGGYASGGNASFSRGSLVLNGGSFYNDYGLTPNININSRGSLNIGDPNAQSNRLTAPGYLNQYAIQFTESLAGSATDVSTFKDSFGYAAELGNASMQFQYGVNFTHGAMTAAPYVFANVITSYDSTALGYVRVLSGATKFTGQSTYYGTTLISADATAIRDGYGATLIAGAANVLSPNSSYVITTGMLDARSFNQTVASLTTNSSQSVLVLSYGSHVLTSKGSVTFGSGSVLQVDLAGFSGSGGGGGTYTKASLLSSAGWVSDVLLTSTNGTISGFNPNNVTFINGTGGGGSPTLPSYIVSLGGGSGTASVALANNNKDLVLQVGAALGLRWFNGASNDATRGTFDLANGETFEVDVALTNQTNVLPGAWDGKSLTKTGAGTLILSANNTFDGNLIVNQGSLLVSDGTLFTGTARATPSRFARISGTSGASLILEKGAHWTIRAPELSVGGYSGSTGAHQGILTVSGVLTQSYYVTGTSISYLNIGVGANNQGSVIVDGPGARMQGNWGGDGQTSGIQIGSSDGGKGLLSVTGGGVFSNLTSHYENYASNADYRSSHNTYLDVNGAQSSIVVSGANSLFEGDWRLLSFQPNTSLVIDDGAVFAIRDRGYGGGLVVANSNWVSEFTVNRSTITVSNATLSSQRYTYLDLRNRSALTVSSNGSVAGGWKLTAEDSAITITSGGVLGTNVTSGVIKDVEGGLLDLLSGATLSVDGSGSKVWGSWLLALRGTNSRATFTNNAKLGNDDPLFAGMLDVGSSLDTNGGYSWLSVDTASSISHQLFVSVGDNSEGLMTFSNNSELNFLREDGGVPLFTIGNSNASALSQGLFYLNSGSIVKAKDLLTFLGSKSGGGRGALVLNGGNYTNQVGGYRGTFLEAQGSLNIGDPNARGIRLVDPGHLSAQEMIRFSAASAGLLKDSVAFKDSFGYAAQLGNTTMNFQYGINFTHGATVAAPYVFQNVISSENSAALGYVRLLSGATKFTGKSTYYGTTLISADATAINYGYGATLIAGGVEVLSKNSAYILNAGVLDASIGKQSVQSIDLQKSNAVGQTSVLRLSTGNTLSVYGGTTVLNDRLEVTVGTFNPNLGASFDLSRASNFNNTNTILIDSLNASGTAQGSVITLGNDLNVVLAGTTLLRSGIDTFVYDPGVVLPSYLLSYFGLVNGNTQLAMGVGLKWFYGASNDATRGTFDLMNGETFTVDVPLTNQTNVLPGAWDGRSLRKAGSGTLILSKNNTFDGSLMVKQGSLIIQSGSVLTGNVNSLDTTVARISGVSGFNASMEVGNGSAAATWTIISQSLDIGTKNGLSGIYAGTLTVNAKGVISQNYFSGPSMLLNIASDGGGTGALTINGVGAVVQGAWGNSTGALSGITLGNFSQGSQGKLTVSNGGKFSNLTSYYTGYATDSVYQNTYNSYLSASNGSKVLVSGAGSLMEGDWKEINLNNAASLVVINGAMFAIRPTGYLASNPASSRSNNLNLNASILEVINKSIFQVQGTAIQLINSTLNVIDEGVLVANTSSLSSSLSLVNSTAEFRGGSNLGGKWKEFSIQNSSVEVKSGATIGATYNSITGAGSMLVKAGGLLSVDGLDSAVTGGWGISVTGANSQVIFNNGAKYEYISAVTGALVSIASDSSDTTGYSRFSADMGSRLINMYDFSLGTQSEGLMTLSNGSSISFNTNGGQYSVLRISARNSTSSSQGLLYLNSGSTINANLLQTYIGGKAGGGKGALVLNGGSYAYTSKTDVGVYLDAQGSLNIGDPNVLGARLADPGHLAGVGAAGVAEDVQFSAASAMDLNYSAVFKDSFNYAAELGNSTMNFQYGVNFVHGATATPYVFSNIISSQNSAALGYVRLLSGATKFTGKSTYYGTTLISADATAINYGYGATLIAGATNILSPNADYVLGKGVLDMSGYSQRVNSLTQGSTGVLKTSLGSTLTVVGSTAIAGEIRLAAGSSGVTPPSDLSRASSVSLGSFVVIDSVTQALDAGITSHVVDNTNYLSGLGAIPSYLLGGSYLSGDQKQLRYGLGLLWTLGSANNANRGTFDLKSGETFNVDVALDNQTNAGSGWDGKSLIVTNSVTGNAGQLILSAKNTFSGNIVLQKGTLTLDHDLALLGDASGSNGSITLGDATRLNIGCLDASLCTNASSNIGLQTDRVVALGSNVSMAVNNRAGANFAGNSFTGTSFTKLGKGALTLSNTTTDLSGAIQVTEGQLVVAGGNFRAGSLVLSSTADLLHDALVQSQYQLIVGNGLALNQWRVSSITATNNQVAKILFDHTGTGATALDFGSTLVTDGTTRLSLDLASGTTRMLTATAFAGDVLVRDSALLQVGANNVLSGNANYVISSYSGAGAGLDLRGTTQVMGSLTQESGALGVLWLSAMKTSTVTNNITLQGKMNVSGATSLQAPNVNFSAAGLKASSLSAFTLSSVLLESVSGTVSLGAGFSADLSGLSGVPSLPDTSALPNYILFSGSGSPEVIAQGKQVLLSMGSVCLTWFCGEGRSDRGVFDLSTVPDFEVDVSLADRSGWSGGDANTLIKRGSGSLILSAPNVYTGGTRIEAGTLEARVTGALGTGLVTLSSTSTGNYTNLLIGSRVRALNLLNNLTIQALTNRTFIELGSYAWLSTSSMISLGGQGQMLVTGDWGDSNSWAKVSSGATLALSGNSMTVFEGYSSLDHAHVTVGGSNALIMFMDNAVVSGATFNLSGSSSQLNSVNSLALYDNSNLSAGSDATQINASNVTILLDGSSRAGNTQFMLSGDTVLRFTGNSSTDTMSLVLEDTATLDILLGGGVATVNNLNGNSSSTSISLGRSKLQVGMSNANMYYAGSIKDDLLTSIVLGGQLEKVGLGTLELAGVSYYSGATTISAGKLLVSGELHNTASIEVKSGATFQLDGKVLQDLSRIPGTIQGDPIMQGPEIVVRSGGQMQVNGTLGYQIPNPSQPDSFPMAKPPVIASNLLVESGAVLSGTGTIISNVTLANGAILKGRSGQTLTLQSLVLNTGSVISLDLSTSGAGAIFSILGDAVLAGTLDVQAGYGVGMYRLMDVAGTITDNGMTVTGGAAGSSYLVKDRGVNLYVGVAASQQAMNFAATAAMLDEAPSGLRMLRGSTGTWNVKTADFDWRGVDDQVASWEQGAMAIFEGTGGEIRSSSYNGLIKVGGMQFANDGFVVRGDPFKITDKDQEAIFRVGDGTLAGANYTAEVSAIMMGDGNLVKTDLGTLILSGIQLYSGKTEVRQGTLQVSGTLSNTDVAVKSGARLTGSGSFQSLVLESGSLFSPGSSQTDRRFGTLRANGDVTIQAGSNLLFDIDASGNHDSLSAWGTLTVAGGNLMINADSGDYGLRTTYKLLTSSTGIVLEGKAKELGGFESVQGDFAFLKPIVTFSDKDVVLTMQRNGVQLADYATNASERSLLNALELRSQRNIDDKTVGAFYGLSETAVVPTTRAFLASEREDANRRLIQNSVYLEDALTRRLDLMTQTVPGFQLKDGQISMNSASQLSFWGQSYQGYGYANNLTDSQGLSIGKGDSQRGVLMGVDMYLNPNLSLGVVGGTEQGFEFETRQRKLDSYHVGFYSGYQLNSHMKLNSGVTYSLSDLTTQRSVSAGQSYQDSFRSNSKVQTTRAFVEFAYQDSAKHEPGKVSIEPFVSASAVHLRAPEYTETGLEDPLVYQAANYTLGYGTAGVRFNQRLDEPRLGAVKLHAMVGVRQLVGNATLTGYRRFAKDGISFFNQTELDKTTGLIDLGVEVDTGKGTQMNFSYGGQYSSTQTDHSLKLKFIKKF